jgi:hypothetical protein
MPGHTTGDAHRSTQARTFVVDDGSVSQVTAIRPLVDRPNTDPVRLGVIDGSPKKKKVLAAAAGSVLLVGGAIAGVVAYQEAYSSNRDPIPVPVLETQTNATSEAPSAAASVDSTTESGSGTNAAVSEPAKPETAPVARKPEQAKRTTTTQTGLDDMDNLVDADDEVIVKGDEIHIGKVKIKDGKVYTPDGNVYEAEQTRRDQRVPGYPQPPPVKLTPEQMQRMTPEQRRKLNILRRRYPGMIPQTSPEDKP